MQGHASGELLGPGSRCAEMGSWLYTGGLSLVQGSTCMLRAGRRSRQGLSPQRGRLGCRCSVAGSCLLLCQEKLEGHEARSVHAADAGMTRVFWHCPAC